MEQGMEQKAKLGDWLEGLEYELLGGSTDVPAADVVYDSRKAAPETVFVCMTGSRIDSHDFIPQVYRAGCRAFVVEKDLQELSENPETAEILSKKDGDPVTILQVGNARHALALLSAARFGHPAKALRVIGLTGTKGKTTVSYMLKSILEHCGKKVGVIGTNGCEIAGVHFETKNTTPESYEINERFRQMLDAGCEYAVMECSSQGFKMHRTDGILFDCGLFLNISPDHIGPLEHADFEEYLSCKAKIFGQSKTGVINADDPHAAELCEAQAGRTDGFRMITYGMENETADLRASELSYRADGAFVGTEFTVSGLRNDRLRLSLAGKFNVSNALAALCVCSLFSLPEEKVREALSEIHVNGRMEIVYKTDRFQVLVDYAHNEVSMESLLSALRSYHPKRLVVVFGCGGNRSKDRRTGMGAAAAKAADHTILTSDNSRFEKPEDIIADIREAYLAAGGRTENLTEIPDRREAICHAISHAQDGDMIAVIGKGHEDYQEINGERTHFSDREEILKAAGMAG
ncbi:MAG: UDP-N-acetylmuramoyl-L-alanyl-D-glutamate--2,6-diaminopimelate ligase [Eubacteriales bacterium]|nr:UDP-N-acetylmuramoyl-L-alanyl-D-glutamate--2,6-diaminopimelate ligase [Eubacteriales bacterium]